MSHPEDLPPKTPEPSFTFTARKSTRNALVAKLITVMGVSLWFGWYFWSYSARQYEAGQRLTPEIYLEKFEEHKRTLLNGRALSENPGVTAMVSFMVIGFIFGAYELVVLGISLIIGKFTRK